MADQFDFIVVGGGSAGCVVANRLVLDHGARVLVLEAGPPDKSPLIRVPAGSFEMLFKGSPFVKRYTSAPQPALNGRSVSIPQGHVLGGGSSVNAMAYTRGSKHDYAGWKVASGGAYWDWDDLLPYFRRQEGNQRLDDESHGASGPLKVSDPAYKVPCADLFIETTRGLGLPHRVDLNDGDLRGVTYMQTTIGDGERCSAARAFLRPILRDPRLTVLTDARVVKIRFIDTRAVGVDFEHQGARRSALSAREVILTAGALATPKLLMLSGVGPAAQLSGLGIRPVVDVPGVGQNLQDHNITYLCATTTGAFGYFGEDRGLRRVRNALRYLVTKAGPIASNGAETMGFLNLTHQGADPDIQLYCVGVLWPTVPRAEQTHGLTLLANLVKPKSRGSVALRSADPGDDPVVNPGWLTHPEDESRLLAALKFLRKISTSHPIKAVIRNEILPGPAVTSDQDMLRFIRNTTESNYHPVGTCRMGTRADPMAVLSDRLEVRGTAGLRVFDASMMPTIISSNTNATVMAVADRAVDLMMRNR
jgi:choline dehydrogenase-like flavoprotein